MKKLNVSMRNYWGFMFVLSGVVLVLAMLATSPNSTRAQERRGYERITLDSLAVGTTGEGRGPNVIDRDSVAYGRTYGEWMAAWNQWSFSIPEATHPLFDNGDCSVGQSGPVWFLGGVFCSNCSSYTRVRDCNLPSGKALFFPVVDWEDSALEEEVAEHPGDLAYQLIGTVRAYIASGVDTWTDMYCVIDERPIQIRRFRVQSTAFGFTLPEDNILSAIYNTPFEKGTYFFGVDDGYDVMLAPLPSGDHVLHFGTSWLDVTYHLHVAR